MANEEHLAILKQGVDIWNAWQPANSVGGRDLSEADLSGAILSGADLSGADLKWADLSKAILSRAILIEADLSKAILSRARLSGADLKWARLSQADLSEADLSGADLSGADLKWADLSGADLNRADLNKADLTGTILSEADLTGTILSEATIGYTVFANTDLSTVKGLDTTRHTAPSTVGIDTLVKSGGQISEVFLRGCGVPDSLIEYLPSLIGAMVPIQFYSCFISYSTKDDEFVKRLHGRLQQEHLRVWFAPEDIQGGKKIHEQLETAIRVYDKLLLVLSADSIQSEWVMTELYNARQAELQQGRRKLFPIRLVDMPALKAWRCFDADTGKDLAREIREYHIPDFSTWKDHDAFEAGFARLLRDLRATEAAPVQRH